MGFFKKNKKGSFHRGQESEMKFDKIILGGTFYKHCENDLVIKNKLENLVPYFNGRIFLENKQEIGKVDEILGPINEFYFSVKLKEGIHAKSFSTDTKFFIDQSQTLPLSRFLPQEKKVTHQPKKKKRSNREKKQNNLSPSVKKPNNFTFRGNHKNDRGGRKDNNQFKRNSGNFRNDKNNFKNRPNSGRKFGNQRGRF
ncbi:H/ACA ribonucleoprotein complex subunit 1, putative [Plasmodium knowlesi strain H]|uniref:H/ACA ribonucleoprotein complex subunit n=3 Tax=Plasmodium knowlesi TaxID=5850 RepID=A0A5K1TWE8_PLAKH|nr:snornp gar1-like protein [Plasmodium knowlesi strain H]OTN63658.1 H/ACA ribonucleoprotein complex subunit [Plasmodium knowlesi]CAA9990698.1 H/ACA ribonucleoprotein complex subunit 1, putative [Plasmodium knowlesi strain H]SBO25904.1 H/ACA ribonucleoprotein complex subunit 1, putative [Plasmodium knowlesi strain H]SBO28660.1 H/ACA ribonucleoprotein complex subunit 1, putative [Plasmodium knowlesi strain H]VVS80172.1 H/ACA ribonucleoprotein complex subunit 1, putative [Plasmodium knowlesi str|eukprot:XP_002261988.1 snornp gar1-like protein [Plasmodium knowlesi strain H]